MESQGAWESNAEYVMMARSYLGHSRTVATFGRSAQRVVCVGATNGSRVLVGAAAHSLAVQNACASSCAAAAGLPGLMRDRAVLPTTSKNHGKLLMQQVQLPVDSAVLYLPLVPSNHVLWYHRVTVADAGSGQTLANMTLNSTGQFGHDGWLAVALRAPQPAGAWLNVTVGLESTGPPGQKKDDACWLAAGWLTDLQVVQFFFCSFSFTLW